MCVHADPYAHEGQRLKSVVFLCCSPPCSLGQKSLTKPGAPQFGEMGRPAGSRDLAAPSDLLPTSRRVPTPLAFMLVLNSDPRVCTGHISSAHHLESWRLGSQRRYPQRTKKLADAELMQKATRLQVKSVGLCLSANVSHTVERACVVTFLTGCKKCNSWTFYLEVC